MRRFTLFKNFNQVVRQIDLQEIIALIQGDKYKEQVAKIQIAIVEGKKEEANQLKKQLPAFTISGQFTGGRQLKYLKNYHPYIILDVDQLSKDDLDRVDQEVKKLHYTTVSFRSPSGRGIKIIVEVDANQEGHAQAYEQVADYYETHLKIKIDRSGKDITRLCFVSYDPNLYYNKDALVFEVHKQDDVLEKLKACLHFTGKKLEYKKGQRNNFIYRLACNCNRKGIAYEEVLRFSKAQFDLADKEIESAVQSAYHHHQEEHAKFKMSPIPWPSLEEQLLKAPTIPEIVFQNLPVILKENCSLFADVRERDVFLTSALGILSGCMSHIEGIYHGRVTHPNLYTMVLAPAASGKSALNYARMLGNRYHEQLVAKSQEAKKKYEREFKQYQKIVAGEGAIPDEPEKPAFKMLYIPANSSAARMTKHLKEGGGKGIICETEADTLGNVLKQDWGGYSDVLRKAFSGERISQSRSREEEYSVLDESKLSVVLSGTPDQLLKLIPSTENGLFSRFVFYTYSSLPIWSDVSPKGQPINLYAYFQEQSKEVAKMIRFWEDHPIKFQLKDHQWKKLNSNFQHHLSKTCTLYGKQANATIKRMGNILFRIAMILTACRQYEENFTGETIDCSNEEFETAFQLIQLYLDHALIILERLPNRKRLRFSQMPNNKRAFFEALPPSFKRKEAISLGLQFQMKTRTIDQLLKDLLGVSLEQNAYGCYQKMGFEGKSK